MGDDVHISACSVEVCKNKWRLEIWNIGHIAALTLCFSSEHVKKFILHHKIKKFLCLWRQFTVHFLSCRKNFLRCSDRRRISIREIDICINIRKLLHANTLSALLVEFIGKRDKVFVLRENGGTRYSYSVNLCSAEDLFSSPAYYLQQNDIVYVEPGNVRANQSTVNGNTIRSTSFWISVTSLIASLISIFL